MSEPILEVRYRVLVGVVDEGINSMDLKEVIRAISTRSNREKDVDILR
jgi:UbiD family decarboxylase